MMAMPEPKTAPITRPSAMASGRFGPTGEVGAVAAWTDRPPWETLA